MKKFWHGRNRVTGKTALIKTGKDGLCWIQMDQFTHPKSYGWHLERRKDWAPVQRKKS